MTKQWDKYKDIILELYVTQKKPLNEVMDIMKTYHQFDAR